MNHIIGRGSPRDPRAIPLGTRAGNWIPNERAPERSPWELQESMRIWAGERPDAIFRSISATYNCIGMAFASRRTWVEPENVDLILREDGYQLLGGPHEVVPGDIVLYKNGDGEISHVGVVIERRPKVENGSWEIWIVSKWGRDGEYIHKIGDAPEILGQPSEYWSERRAQP